MSSEADISSDDTVYPDLSEQIGANNRMKSQVANNTSKNRVTILDPASGATSIFNTVESYQSNSDFEKRIFRELHILSLKIDDISEGINVLLKTKADETRTLVCNDIPEIMKSFLVNDSSLTELEN